MDTSIPRSTPQQEKENPLPTPEGIQNSDIPKSEGVPEQASLIEKMGQLERLVRASGRDTLTLGRAQQDSLAALQSVMTLLNNLDLDLKGVSQMVWRATQENQQTIQGVEEHYAGALRDLEKRIREEIHIQTLRSLMRGLLPALDDLDLILSQQARTDTVAEEPFVKGVQLVRRKIVQGLREQGFEEIPVQPGKTSYDPQKYEVVEADIPGSLFEQPDAAPQTILFVRRAGFTYNGQVFRAPQVFVKES